MASSKEYVNYIMEQLSSLEGVRCRAMMGEYVLYYKDRIAGGIYDNRLLVKPVQAALDYMPDAAWELPYEGAKKMLLAGNVDDRVWLTGLFEAIYDQLPEPKKKKRKEPKT